MRELMFWDQEPGKGAMRSKTREKRKKKSPGPEERHRQEPEVREFESLDFFSWCFFALLSHRQRHATRFPLFSFFLLQTRSSKGEIRDEGIFVVIVSCIPSVCLSPLLLACRSMQRGSSFSFRVTEWTFKEKHWKAASLISWSERVKKKRRENEEANKIQRTQKEERTVF